MTMMMLMAQGVPLVNLFNINNIAAEALNTLVKNLGLVTVAPFTAFVGGLVYRLEPGAEFNKNRIRLF